MSIYFGIRNLLDRWTIVHFRLQNSISLICIWNELKIADNEKEIFMWNASNLSCGRNTWLQFNQPKTSWNHYYVSNQLNSLQFIIITQQNRSSRWPAPCRHKWVRARSNNKIQNTDDNITLKNLQTLKLNYLGLSSLDTGHRQYWQCYKYKICNRL